MPRRSSRFAADVSDREGAGLGALAAGRARFNRLAGVFEHGRGLERRAKRGLIIARKRAAKPNLK